MAGERPCCSLSPALRWKGRNHFNFIAGLTRLRVLPVVLHLLSEDIEWFSKDPSLFDELKSLLQDRVVAATSNGDKDAEAPKTRKRARKEELCVQGERLQFTYRYRKTSPRYTVLLYANDTTATGADAQNANAPSANSNAGGSGPGFRHYPLSESSLLVWVYRFDSEDRYKPVPNEAGLQFASSPVTHPPLSSSANRGQALVFEGTAEDTIGERNELQSLSGPRDTGLLRWLWGDKEDGVGVGGGAGAGGVRQHFLGSAAWQGRPEAKVGRPSRRSQEEDDLQLAISLSLKKSGKRERVGTGEVQDLVEILDDDDGDDVGVEESKASR